MSVAMLVMSVALLGVGALLAALLWPRNGHDRCWIGLGAVVAQIGVVSMATSAAHAFAAPAVLGAQAAIVGGLALVVRLRGARERLEWGAAFGPLWGEIRSDWAAIVLLIAAGGLLLGSGVSQAFMPLHLYDDQNYHGPMLLYWLQNRSTFPFPTHNLRQSLYPAGSGLVSVWPLLFVKGEWLCRMAFWMCVPLGAAGVWSVARTVGLNARGAAGAAALWCSTPTVTQWGESLKSDSWLAVFLLGSVYWLCARRPDGERPGVRFVLSAVFLAFAANCKITALTALPAVLAVAIMGVRGWSGRRGALFGTAVGLGAGTALSGLAVILIYCSVNYGHPLGPRIFRAATKPAEGWSAHATQMLRVPFILADFPEVWSEPVRSGLETAGASVSRWTGAADVIPGEERWAYPGRFEYRVGWVARAYSLGGILWLPTLTVAGVWCLRRQLLAREPVGGISVPALMSACMLVTLAWLVRWMADGANRFWLGPYALSVPVTVAIISRWTRTPFLAAIVCLGTVWTVYPSFRRVAARAATAVARTPPPNAAEEPWAEVARALPPGSVVLLIAGDMAREWRLFDPAHGFANQVWSWAGGTPDPEGVTTMLERVPITHVVLERDTVVGVNWNSKVSVGPILQMLRSRSDFLEVPLTTPQRLFERVPGAPQESPG